MISTLKNHRLSLNKSLGQHFLANDSYLQKIVDAASLKKDSPVFEIGLGSGNLTKKILETRACLISLEKDTRWVEVLNKEIVSDHFTLIHEDALKFNPGRLNQYAPPPYKVLGNLPYNIATEIIFHLLDYRDLFTDFYFMVQKEVGDRMKSQEGSKDYGVLSIMVQIYCEVKTLFHIPPGAFVPPPKIQSSLMHLKIFPEPRWPIQDMDLFKKMVRASFQQRRKTLSNTLSPFFPSKKDTILFLESQDIPPSTRPEEVSMTKWVAIANSLHD